MRRRTELLARYRDELERADAERSEPHTELIEQATDPWDAWVLSVLGEADARELTEVIAAIKRLDAGTYGICVECSGKISVHRLEALPASAECIECAVGIEQSDGRAEQR